MKTVDASGAVVNGYTYDVYGKKTSSTGSQANEFDFAGSRQTRRGSSTCVQGTTTRRPGRS